MLDIEKRLKNLEDRAALQSTFIDYIAVVDSMSDVNRVLSYFTEYAVLDLRGIDQLRLDGRASLKDFFTSGFADKKRLAHFVTNFRVGRLEDNKADCYANLMTTWETLSGREGLAYVQCELSYVRMGGCWKIDGCTERALMQMIQRSTIPIIGARYVDSAERQD